MSNSAKSWKNFVRGNQQVEHIENIIQSIDQNIAVIDMQQNLVIWNDHMERQFIGENAYGKNLRELFPRFWEEYQGQVWGELLSEEVMKQGIIKELLRYPIKDKEHKNRYFDIKGTPLRNKQGEIIGAILLMNDITNRVYLENQLHRQVRTTSLANLGASIAHEIRNPLNSISLIIQLVKEGIEQPAGTSREEMAEDLENVLGEIRRLDSIIREFLDFSRPHTPRLILADPHLGIRQAMRLLAEQARQSHIKIIENYNELPRVMMDQNQLSQAIYNICLNAIQEMKKQGGGTLEINTLANKDYALIEIKDNGPGLDNSVLDKLFDLFYTTKEDGSGLGLPIANQIIERHEGKIVAENNLDCGACFSIYLPVNSKKK